VVVEEEAAKYSSSIQKAYKTMKYLSFFITFRKLHNHVCTQYV